ncbi:nitrilase-related carbon-nitrogen hydrolase [Paraburkholderia bengalensis]|uniref:nitrilase-related carbon-nitrogen hydrolase n=1 Tax=Paraburkholderia bengalensis TaxID=2747562 RepID=UPI003014CF64
MCSMPAATLRVASIPFAAQRGAVDHNVARVVAHIECAARAGVGLAVFPEASLTGGIDSRTASAGDARRPHRAELKALAVGIDSPCVRAVAAAVDRTGVAAGVGLIERAASGELYDSYAVCLPGGERHVHRMLQTDGQPHIARGDGFTVFDTPAGWRLAVLVGGDHYLVENARMASLLGAALLVAPHACPDAATMGSEADETNAWTRHALPARALDNGMFVVYSDGGYGAIVDPFGRIVARGEHGAADGRHDRRGPRSRADRHEPWAALARRAASRSVCAARARIACRCRDIRAAQRKRARFDRHELCDRQTRIAATPLRQAREATAHPHDFDARARTNIRTSITADFFSRPILHRSSLIESSPCVVYQSGGRRFTAKVCSRYARSQPASASSSTRAR